MSAVLGKVYENVVFFGDFVLRMPDMTKKVNMYYYKHKWCIFSCACDLHVIYMWPTCTLLYFVVQIYRKHKEWFPILKWAVGFCNESSGIFAGPHATQLHLVSNYLCSFWIGAPVINHIYIYIYIGYMCVWTVYGEYECVTYPSLRLLWTVFDQSLSRLKPIWPIRGPQSVSKPGPIWPIGD